MQWSKQDRKPCSINVVPIKGFLRAWAGEDRGQWVPFAAFDCRGLEPIAFHPRDGFEVTSTGGATFTNVDLSEEWADYDEDNDHSISILGLEAKFELAP